MHDVIYVSHLRSPSLIRLYERTHYCFSRASLPTLDDVKIISQFVFLRHVKMHTQNAHSI